MRKISAFNVKERFGSIKEFYYTRHVFARMHMTILHKQYLPLSCSCSWRVFR